VRISSNLYRARENFPHFLLLKGQKFQTIVDFDGFVSFFNVLNHPNVKTFRENNNVIVTKFYKAGGRVSADKELILPANFEYPKRIISRDRTKLFNAAYYDNVAGASVRDLAEMHNAVNRAGNLVHNIMFEYTKLHTITVSHREEHQKSSQDRISFLRRRNSSSRIY